MPTAETGAPAFIVFDVLQLLALVLLVAMLLPALLSQSVYRQKSWFNLVVACVFYCISFLLRKLLYLSSQPALILCLVLGHQSGPEPPFPLCIFQAGLIYAAPPSYAIDTYPQVCLTLKFTESPPPVSFSLPRYI
jgi:hypothetical protein